MDFLAKLLRLTAGREQEEDFFTEVIAELLDNHPEILGRWLGSPFETSDVTIETQPHFGRRPDLVAAITSENGTSWVVLIESKIGSEEGHAQLIDYAKLLCDWYAEAERRSLVYVTRDYDPKDEFDVLADVPCSVDFVQRRWHEFYRLLKEWMATQETEQPDYLAQQVLTFMEDRGMAMANQFSPTALVTLANCRSAILMMREILSGEVSDRFQEVFGKPSQPSSWTTQLEWHNRYAMYTYKGNLALIAGFWLHSSDGYPEARVLLEVEKPDADLFQDLKSISGEWNWAGKELEKRTKYSGIYKANSLRQFSADEDHVVACKEFFLKALAELEQFASKYPRWFSPTDEPAGEETPGDAPS